MNGLVGDGGFEPPTSTMSTWRSTPELIAHKPGGRRKILKRCSHRKTYEEFPGAEFITVAGPADLTARAAEADVNLGYCTAEAIAAATRLVWVQIFSSGAEACLAVERTGNGEVLLTNMQKMSSPAIGEHAVAMALALSRALVRFGKEMPALGRLCGPVRRTRSADR